MSQAGTLPDSGPVSVDELVAHWDAQDEQKPSGETVEPEAAPAAEAEITEAVPAVEGEGEADKPNAGEGAETGEAEQPPIDPPQFWKAEAKDRFRELPRELQEVVLEQETSRNAFTSKAAQDAAETRKAAEAERTRLATFSEQLATLLPRAEKTFEDRWANVDWVALTDEVGAEQAQKFKFQLDAEKQELDRIKQAQSALDAETTGKFQNERAQQLREMLPEFVDPKTSSQVQNDVLRYTVETLGYEPDAAVKRMTAKEILTVHRALQWERSQAQALELAAKPKPAAQPAKPAPKPSSAQPVRFPKTARLQELTRKRSLSIDETTELFNLREALQ